MNKRIFYLIHRVPIKIAESFYRRWNPVKFWIIGVTLGKNPMISGEVVIKIGKNSKIEIGDSFVFTSGLTINPLCRNIRGTICADDGASVKIGHNVGLSSACVWAHESIQIGNNVKVGGDTIILDSDAHSMDFMIRRDSILDMESKINKPIVIGDDVLIGTRCIILKGCHIGNRSVIGSGSIVTKDIPPNEIWAGNPARFIRSIT
jgi:acetyltransferase-like isoleucine patch superfamily enzyme